MFVEMPEKIQKSPETPASPSGRPESAPSAGPEGARASVLRGLAGGGAAGACVLVRRAADYVKESRKGGKEGGKLEE